jgi:RNA polymerase sigma-70 factor (ECF subfamily)
MLSPKCRQACENRLEGPTSAPLSQKNESGTYEESILPYEGALRTFVQRRVRNADSDDICQEVLLRAHLMRGTFKEHSNIRTWVLSIAHHVVVDYYRLKKRSEIGKSSLTLESSGSLHTSRDSADRLLDAREHIECCLRCITSNLSLEEQIAVLLCDVYAASDAEGARVIRKSVNAHKHLLHNARSKLHDSRCGECFLVAKAGIDADWSPCHPQTGRALPLGSSRRGCRQKRLLKLRHNLLQEILYFDPRVAGQLSAL